MSSLTKQRKQLNRKSHPRHDRARASLAIHPESVEETVARQFERSNGSPADLMQQQSVILAMGGHLGNARLQNHHELLPRRSLQTTGKAIQLQPEEAKSGTEVAAQAASTSDNSDWNAIVQAKLEEFLQRFSNIPVEVPIQENGKSIKQTIYVHPPYFLNTIRTEHSRQRLENAKKNRKDATGKESKVPVKASGAALTGKSTPEEIQSILQEAVDKGKIKAPKDHISLDSEDLRNWLIKYGIGIDCSGFVSQALNEVMTEVHEQAGISLSDIKKINKGSSQLKGGSSGFTRVEQPSALQPGDTVHTSGHIRIVMHVEQTDDGVIFTTAESHSGKNDEGTASATWRFPNPNEFKKLQKQVDGQWQKTSPIPTFGRYQALKKFEQEHALD